MIDCLNPCSNGRYSRSSHQQDCLRGVDKVLILVLMEDTLGVGIELEGQDRKPGVLILVLMEDTLGASWESEIRDLLKVLILVLMEDTLGEALN